MLGKLRLWLRSFALGMSTVALSMGTIWSGSDGEAASVSRR